MTNKIAQLKLVNFDQSKKKYENHFFYLNIQKKITC